MSCLSPWNSPIEKFIIFLSCISLSLMTSPNFCFYKSVCVIAWPRFRDSWDPGVIRNKNMKSIHSFTPCPRVENMEGPNLPRPYEAAVLENIQEYIYDMMPHHDVQPKQFCFCALLHLWPPKRKPHSFAKISSKSKKSILREIVGKKSIMAWYFVLRYSHGDRFTAFYILPNSRLDIEFGRN